MPATRGSLPQNQPMPSRSTRSQQSSLKSAEKMKVKELVSPRHRRATASALSLSGKTVRGRNMDKKGNTHQNSAGESPQRARQGSGAKTEQDVHKRKQSNVKLNVKSKNEGKLSAQATDKSGKDKSKQRGTTSEEMEKDVKMMQMQRKTRRSESLSQESPRQSKSSSLSSAESPGPRQLRGKQVDSLEDSLKLSATVSIQESKTNSRTAEVSAQVVQTRSSRQKKSADVSILESPQKKDNIKGKKSPVLNEKQMASAALRNKRRSTELLAAEYEKEKVGDASLNSGTVGTGKIQQTPAGGSRWRRSVVEDNQSKGAETESNVDKLSDRRKAESANVQLALVGRRRQRRSAVESKCSETEESESNTLGRQSGREKAESTNVQLTLTRESSRKRSTIEDDHLKTIEKTVETPTGEDAKKQISSNRKTREAADQVTLTEATNVDVMLLGMVKGDGRSRKLSEGEKESEDSHEGGRVQGSKRTSSGRTEVPVSEDVTPASKTPDSEPKTKKARLEATSPNETHLKNDKGRGTTRKRSKSQSEDEDGQITSHQPPSKKIQTSEDEDGQITSHQPPSKKIQPNVNNLSSSELLSPRRSGRSVVPNRRFQDMEVEFTKRKTPKMSSAVPAIVKKSSNEAEKDIPAKKKQPEAKKSTTEKTRFKEVGSGIELTGKDGKTQIISKENIIVVSPPTKKTSDDKLSKVALSESLDTTKDEANKLSSEDVSSSAQPREADKEFEVLVDLKTAGTDCTVLESMAAISATGTLSVVSSHSEITSGKSTEPETGKKVVSLSGSKTHTVMTVSPTDSLHTEKFQSTPATGSKEGMVMNLQSSTLESLSGSSLPVSTSAKSLASSAASPSKSVVTVSSIAGSAKARKFEDLAKDSAALKVASGHLFTKAGVSEWEKESSAEDIADKSATDSDSVHKNAEDQVSATPKSSLKMVTQFTETGEPYVTIERSPRIVRPASTMTREIQIPQGHVEKIVVSESCKSSSVTSPAKQGLPPLVKIVTVSQPARKVGVSLLSKSTLKNLEQEKGAKIVELGAKQVEIKQVVASIVAAPKDAKVHVAEDESAPISMLPSSSVVMATATDTLFTNSASTSTSVTVPYEDTVMSACQTDEIRTSENSPSVEDAESNEEALDDPTELGQNGLSKYTTASTQTPIEASEKIIIPKPWKPQTADKATSIVKKIIVNVQEPEREDLSEGDKIEVGPSKQQTQEFIFVQLPEGATVKQQVVNSRERYDDSMFLSMDDDGVYQCTECQYKTVRKANWYKHKKKHLGIRPHHCTQCNYQAATSSNLKRHMAIHADLRAFHCHLCNLNFRQKIHLERHIKYKHEEKQVKCPLCDYVCANENPDLKIHIKRRHIPNEEGNGSVQAFTCEECGLVALSKRDLRQHMKFHRRGPELKLFCEHCSFVTDCESRLRRHMYIHTKEKPYQCGLCEYRGSQKEHVLRHMKSQHNIEIERRSRRSSSDSPGLDQIEAKDIAKLIEADYTSRDKIFACNHCSMKFSKLINLYKHLHAQHQGVMPSPKDDEYSCVVCDFRTGSKKNLLVHMRKHNTQDHNPPSHVYSCVLCRYANPKRRNLFQHMKKKHHIEIVMKDDGSTSCFVADTTNIREDEDQNIMTVGDVVTATTANMDNHDDVGIQNVLSIEDLATMVSPQPHEEGNLIIDQGNATIQQISISSLVQHEAAEAIEGLQALAQQAGLVDNIVEEKVQVMGTDEQTVTVMEQPVSEETTVETSKDATDAPAEDRSSIQLSAEQLLHLSSGDYVEINGEMYKVEITTEDSGKEGVVQTEPVMIGSDHTKS